MTATSRARTAAGERRARSAWPPPCAPPLRPSRNAAACWGRRARAGSRPARLQAQAAARLTAGRGRGGQRDGDGGGGGGEGRAAGRSGRRGNREPQSGSLAATATGGCGGQQAARWAHCCCRLSLLPLQRCCSPSPSSLRAELLTRLPCPWLSLQLPAYALRSTRGRQQQQSQRGCRRQTARGTTGGRALTSLGVLCTDNQQQHIAAEAAE